MKSLKKITPEFAKSLYHKAQASAAAAKNRFPANDMLVIGVTGTKGKTSTANYIWSVLTAGGYKAGLISSANFRIGEKEEVNPYHMTMPNPFLIQRKLAEMRAQGVSVVVMEMTSEGMKQHRHTGIPVDMAVFTNLTPEHLASHKGDFQVYKEAKGALFRALNQTPKTFFGKKVPSTIIANADSEHSKYYLHFYAQRKVTFGLHAGETRAKDVVAEKSGTTFTVDEWPFRLSIPGEFNVYNALPALIVGKLLDIPMEKISHGLTSLAVIPGRMEAIDEGQGFDVFVDYAHEPASLSAVLGMAEKMAARNTAEAGHTTAGEGDPSHGAKGGRIILLIGVIGGGRQSRDPLAEIGARRASSLVITNEDPYDEDPEALIAELAKVAERHGKKTGRDLFPILDRREAIRKALSLAGPGDVVLVTGKGAETTMMTKDGPVPWSERRIVRELVRESVGAVGTKAKSAA